MIEKNTNLNLVFMGPPGVGKGTIASLIAQQTNYLHLSTGNIFREAITSKSKLGLEISNLVNSGQYVPDSITNKIVKDRIEKCKKNEQLIILDGYPRTLEQVKFLDDIKNFKYVVIELSAPENLILERLSGRRQCPNCQANFHIKFKPSSKGEICDKCDNKLITRKDDAVEAIKIRQSVYQKQTKPLLDYYYKHNKLFKFDGSGAAQNIASDIIQKLKLK